GGRVADQVVMRVVEVLLSFPGLLLALLVITVFGAGPLGALTAIALAEAPHHTRLARGQLLVVRGAPYVEAAVSLGRRRTAVTLAHVLPNAVGPVLSLGAVGVGTAVMISAALSFLGLGAQEPAPEWGSMLADGREFVTTAWWLAVFPGVAVTLVVASSSVLGRRARRTAGRLP
ncbi:ABC transporter permease, partial [Actinosynnema sp. NPDC023658]|uniref:ABC transporter permease n=1 Tax=Actinosynnema sp. NPDC023658 TaxID=3155465 RepID=UPI0033F57493